MERAEVGAVIDGMTVKWVIELGPEDELTPDQMRVILEWPGVVHFIKSSGGAMKMAGVE